ncbi:hypothetical protein B0H19DRAFT_1268220 [Mycena capillaripes]|nr:hypothetical protein B0H19DRAFT_1268220 [Mycena capillaripes]
MRTFRFLRALTRTLTPTTRLRAYGPYQPPRAYPSPGYIYAQPRSGSEGGEVVLADEASTLGPAVRRHLHDTYSPTSYAPASSAHHSASAHLRRNTLTPRTYTHDVTPPS